MVMQDNEELKKKIRNFWDNNPCGSTTSSLEKLTKEYFDEIEEFRYRLEPEIFQFAQFTRFHGKRVLEVGVGLGTDFIQWVRAGAEAYGIDLTNKGIEQLTYRLKLYNLEAKELKVADAENIPYPDKYFDLVYSWGVIHHTPDTEKALEEIIRVTKPGGIIKIMVYNRRSLYVFYKYLKYGLFAGKPFRSLKNIIYNHQESLGTKAYTFNEVRSMLKKYPVKVIQLDAPLTSYDLYFNLPLPLRIFAKMYSVLFGNKKAGWFLRIELKKID